MSKNKGIFNPLLIYMFLHILYIIRHSRKNWMFGLLKQGNYSFSQNLVKKLCIRIKFLKFFYYSVIIQLSSFNCNLLCQIKGTFWNSCNSCDGLVLKSGLSFNITICTLQGVKAVGMGKEAQNLPVAAELYKKAQVVYITHMSCMHNTYKLYM